MRRRLSDAEFGEIAGASGKGRLDRMRRVEAALLSVSLVCAMQHGRFDNLRHPLQC